MFKVLIRPAFSVGLMAAILAVAMLTACGQSSVPAGTQADGGSTGATSGGATSGGSTGGGTTGSVTPGDGKSIFLSILPPGENGNSAGGVGTPVPGVPVLSYPKNFRDQLDMYGNLSYAKQGLKSDNCVPPTDITQHVKASDQACNYFKREGLTPDTVVSSLTLTAPNGKQVRIQRDGWGVPFVNGDDRESAEYGVGYASAQDRLWLYDLLRHLGRGNLSQFLGPSETTYALDLQFGTAGGYNEDELAGMISSAHRRFGTLGDLAVDDVNTFVAGMNAYVAFLKTPQGASQIPPEYASLKIGGFPTPDFTPNDIVASATLILAEFGGGGGGEVTNELLLQHLDSGFRPGATQLAEDACKLWRDLRHANDPESPVTTEASFPTQSPARLDETCPQTLPAGAAIWDPGSYQGRALFSHGGILGLPSTPGLPLIAPGKPLQFDLAAAVPALSTVLAQTERPVRVPLKVDADAAAHSPAVTTMVASVDPYNEAHKALVRLGLAMPNTLSNWIGVNADQTQDGHPIVVMGPQTSYYVPQLLSEIAVTSNGGTPLDFATRGIITVNLPYVVIGRGSHYAWSATSGESDLIDTRVSYLCNTDGTPASREDADGDGFPDADGYLFDAGDGKGPQCRRLYKRLDTWTAVPTVASLALGGSAVPETVKRYILRTHYGYVFATATVNGQPVAISTQRTTFNDELSTIAPFTLVGTQQPMNKTHFDQLFNSMTASFNWMYTDEKDVGFIHSGLYPQRSPQQQAELPVWGDGRYEWAVDQGKLDAAFFTQYGGDGNNGGVTFGTRIQPVAQGDPLKGYFEYPGYLSLAAHPKVVNPDIGYLMSWNNRPAKDWWAADSNGSYGAIHRVDMLRKRLKAFQASGKKFQLGNMVEIMADTGYTDLRAQEVLPLLIRLMQTSPLTVDQQSVVSLMQTWVSSTSSANWIGPTASGLGGWRRDRDGDGIYDQRAAVVLMDAWYPHLIDSMLPQLTALDTAGVSTLQGRYDAPRAQGSAFQEGYFEHMERVLQMVLNTPGHTDYRALKCADGSAAGCRTAVLNALDLALADLGGLSNQANWDGTQLVSAQYGKTGHTVEDYDMIRHESFSFLPVPPIPWVNRPTFQQAVEVQSAP